MVDNMGGLNLPHNQLKIKGKDGQKIDLTKLDGLQITEKNKSLFSKFDKNNNGKIDNDEILSMASNLAKIAGNGKISKREIEKALGQGSYEGLSKLADQQNSVKNDKTYTEIGENSIIDIKPDGTRIETDKKTFNMTEFSPSGKISVKDSRGVLISTTENKDGKIITNEYQELGNGKTCIKNFEGEKDNKTLNHIDVVDKKANTETIYKTEEDMKNNKPLAFIENANNPITKRTTTYTYNDDGTVSTKTIDSAEDIVETTTENKTHGFKKTIDKNGKITLTTKDNQPITQLEFTVVEGKDIRYQMEEMLKKYDISLTEEQKTNFEKELIKENKNPIDGSTPRIKTNKNGATYFLKEIDGNSVTATFDLNKLNDIISTESDSPVAQDIKPTETPETDDQTKVDSSPKSEETPETDDSSIDEPSDDDSSDDDEKIEDEEVEVEKKEPEHRVEETEEGHEKVEYHEPVEIKHKTGPKEGENPQYDAIVKGQTQNPVNKPAETKPKNNNLTQDDINKAINNLKPGETYSYTSSSSINLTGYKSSERQTIRFRRNNDGTLTKNFTDFAIVNKRFNQIEENYSADGKTLLSRKSITGAKELKGASTTIEYNNGKPTTSVTDLRDLSKINYDFLYRAEKRIFREINPGTGFINKTAGQKVSAKDNSIYSSKELKNSNGEVVLTYKDGKYYNKKGKEISEDKAYNLVEKLVKNNDLSELVQNYK